MALLIHDEGTMAVLTRACEELQQLGKVVPPESHYERKLAALWERARTTEFYQDIGPFSRGRFDQLRLTSKDVLKATPLSFITRSLAESTKYYETTGTTGRPTPTPRLTEDIVWNTVSVAEAWREILSPRDRVAVLLPSDLVPIADLVVGVCEYLELTHVRAYPFATGICDWDRLFAMWQTFQPSAMVIAPGVAIQLSRLAKRRGLLGQLRVSVDTVMLLGEVNTEPFRTRLRQWWQARVFDASYGSTESGTLAASCASGRQHLLPSTNYFELAREDGIVGLEKLGSGRLIVTPLNHYARPLLRLDTGDEVTVTHGCPCGRATPRVEVHGRSSDGVPIQGRVLRSREIEEVVYGLTEATGYLIEMSAKRPSAILLLERDVDWDRDLEKQLSEVVWYHSLERLGIKWDAVRFVNSLPATTKSGASQKSWKRSNLRVVEADV